MPRKTKQTHEQEKAKAGSAVLVWTVLDGQRCLAHVYTDYTDITES